MWGRKLVHTRFHLSASRCHSLAQFCNLYSYEAALELRKEGRGAVAITHGASAQHPTASELHINTLGPRDCARVS